jgi:hypothetical protein
MTLPASGAISMSQVNTELGLSSTAQLSLNCSALRTLFGIASGAISLNDGHGKASGGSQIFLGPYSNSGYSYHTWIVPSGVTSVSVLAQAPGGSSYSGNSGTGGAVMFVNNYPVTPGNMHDFGIPGRGGTSGQTAWFGSRPNTLYSGQYYHGPDLGYYVDSPYLHCCSRGFIVTGTCNYWYTPLGTKYGGGSGTGGVPLQACNGNYSIGRRFGNFGSYNPCMTYCQLVAHKIYNALIPGTCNGAYGNVMNLCGGGSSAVARCGGGIGKGGHGAANFRHDCAPTNTGTCSSGRAYRASNGYYAYDYYVAYGPNAINPSYPVNTGYTTSCSCYGSAGHNGRAGGAGGGGSTVLSTGYYYALSPGSGGGGNSSYGTNGYCSGQAGSSWSSGGTGSWHGTKCCQGFSATSCSPTAAGGTGACPYNRCAYGYLSAMKPLGGGGGGAGGVAYNSVHCSYYGGDTITNYVQGSGGSGGAGFFRIVWPGCSRKFPRTNVGPGTP